MKYIYEDILKNIIIKAWKFNDYLYIMENFRNTNVFLDDDFKRKYNSFYKVRRNEKWRDVYFSYLEINKNRSDLTFKEVINYIYKKTGSIEPSFSSKLLATVNPEMPIWDKNVLKYLKFKHRVQKGTNQIDDVINIYNKICLEYKKMLTDQRVIEQIEFLRKLIGADNITDTKMLDFVIWTLGENAVIDENNLG